MARKRRSTPRTSSPPAEGGGVPRSSAGVGAPGESGAWGLRRHPEPFAEVPRPALRAELPPQPGPGRVKGGGGEGDARKELPAAPPFRVGAGRARREGLPREPRHPSPGASEVARTDSYLGGRYRAALADWESEELRARARRDTAEGIRPDRPAPIDRAWDTITHPREWGRGTWAGRRPRSSTAPPASDWTGRSVTSSARRGPGARRAGRPSSRRRALRSGPGWRR